MNRRHRVADAADSVRRDGDVTGEHTGGFAQRAERAQSGILVAEGLACAAGRRTVVSDVSFTVRAGETIGIVGPNGTGKTTLLQVLAGVRKPVRGRVLVDGQVLHGLSARRRARTVASVAQDERPPADLRAGEVVALGRTPYLPPWGAGSPREQQVIEQALATVDLAGFADRPVHHLSGGERQRVLLARALVQDTPVLLLDEPTNHLDVTHRLELLALARTLHRTVVMALHDLTLADRYCDRILVLHNGTAHPLAPPATALAPDVVEAVFAVQALRVPHPATGHPHLLITPRLP
ncbi:ABC transporter ATP-binding protein [Nocardia brasiliensis]|uniref:ABC transporter ATP-binding protein n=1 Tax=Nocardia brasiliensis TaxID=37326 RepID=UPI001E2AF39F|nr:ABC transporter ATP-binding protein [Nocardia brasiliensis]